MLKTPTQFDASELREAIQVGMDWFDCICIKLMHDLKINVSKLYGVSHNIYDPLLRKLYLIQIHAV